MYDQPTEDLPLHFQNLTFKEATDVIVGDLAPHGFETSVFEDHDILAVVDGGFWK